MDTFLEINAAFPWFFPLLSFVFGAIVGSFLNVCIYRIPAERSIVHPGSTCACGRPIAWYDNIPIVSWIVLRGRARCCGQRFSIRYPAVELLTGLLFLFAWLQHPPVKAIAGMILAALLVCGSFIDLDHMIIPDRFSIGTAVVGLALSFALPALHDQASGIFMLDAMRSLIASVTGLLIGSAVILWIALLAEVVLRKEAMGMGDVKLVGAIGAFCGWEGAVFSVFGGAVIGTLAFAAVLLVHGLFGRKKSAGGEESPIGFGRHTPFGPMLSAGALVYYLWAFPWVDGYFAAISDIVYHGF